MQTQTIGDIRIDRLMESEGAFASADFLFPDIAPNLIETQAEWLIPSFVDPVTQKLIMSFHSLLIRSPRSTIYSLTISIMYCARTYTPITLAGIHDWSTANGYRLFQTHNIFLANSNISTGLRLVVRTQAIRHWTMAVSMTAYCPL